jgi:hypothetical protein
MSRANGLLRARGSVSWTQRKPDDRDPDNYGKDMCFWCVCERSELPENERVRRPDLVLLDGRCVESIELRRSDEY